MNPRYPVPFVRHSVGQQQPPTQGPQPPIVMDVQRLVEHMKADFRAELQLFKEELLAEFRRELVASKPVVEATTMNVAGDSSELTKLLRRMLEQGGRSVQAPVPAQEEQSITPIFMPSDLLAPREGTVAVKTSEEGSGALNASAEILKQMKKKGKPA